MEIQFHLHYTFAFWATIQDKDNVYALCQLIWKLIVYTSYED